MMDEYISPTERDVLLKLETGDYLLKFGQLYKVDRAMLSPTGPQLGGVVDKLLNKGLIELQRLTINGLQFKAHMITAYGRKRLERS